MTQVLLESLHRSGILRLARLLPRYRLVVLNYHRVRDDGGEFHDGLIELGPEKFREQLLWLRERVQFLCEDDLEKVRERGRPKVLLTFDDGYRDSFDIIAPILSELGIPAIFFVSPGLIDKRTLGAWDRIAYLVKKFKSETFSFRGKSYSLSSGARPVFLELGRISQQALPDRGDEFVRELAATLGVAEPSHELQAAELMGWNEIRELQKSGFAIGCHSYSHRVLSSLSHREQEQEILLARARLGSEGVQAKSFAYPYGEPFSYAWETRELVLGAGFKYIFSFAGNSQRISTLDPSRIDRVPFKSTLAKYDFLISFPLLSNLAQSFRIGGA